MANLKSKTVQSKISVKSQTVLPLAVREKLGVKPGDTLLYIFDAQGIRLEKSAATMDEAAFASFTEWASTEDDVAYVDL